MAFTCSVPFVPSSSPSMAAAVQKTFEKQASPKEQSLTSMQDAEFTAHDFDWASVSDVAQTFRVVPLSLVVGNAAAVVVLGVVEESPFPLPLMKAPLSAVSV